MKPLFEPSAVLVVGVSQSEGNMGRNIVMNLIHFGYRGQIFLYGRKEGFVAGHRIHTTFDTLPEGVIDVAAILAPAPAIPEIIDRCGALGIRHAIIESGGFGELGEGQNSLEQTLLEATRKWGIRFTGPNGLGVVVPRIGLVSPFMQLAAIPEPGRTSLLSQSGGVGVVGLFGFARENIGLDVFVSMGNKLSLDEADYLEYLTAADTSDAVCLYLEHIGRGRRFFQAVRDFKKPVLIQKSNTSNAGHRAASSHTAALVTDDALVDAGVKWSGAIRVHDQERLLEGAMAFQLPGSKGKRVLILSRSGGHAVIAADMAEEMNLELPELTLEIEALATKTARAGVIRALNPLDLGDVFDFQVYEQMVEAAAKSGMYDACVFIQTVAPGIEVEPTLHLLKRIEEIVQVEDFPVFVSVLTDPMTFDAARKRVSYPIFANPESLMRALGVRSLWEQSQLRLKERHYEVFSDIKLGPIAQVLKKYAPLPDDAEGRTWISAEDAFAVLDCARIPVAPHAVAHSQEEASLVAQEWGTPVAMKLLSDAMLHKAGGGGVELNVPPEKAGEVWNRFLALQKTLVTDASFDGVLLQPMVPGDREVFLGGQNDPSFGAVVAAGQGGTGVEERNDVTMRLCPVSGEEVDEMFGEVMAFKVDRRGDYNFLKERLLRLADLLVHFPEIREVDINPIKLNGVGAGGLAVDCRIALARPARG